MLKVSEYQEPVRSMRLHELPDGLREPACLGGYVYAGLHQLKLEPEVYVGYDEDRLVSFEHQGWVGG